MGQLIQFEPLTYEKVLNCLNDHYKSINVGAILFEIATIEFQNWIKIIL